MRIVAPVLAFAAMAVAFASPASAATEYYWMANVDGDSTPEPVILSEIPTNPDAQKLTVKLGRIAYTVSIPYMPGPDGLRPPKVVDVNGDRRQEIVVTETMGANTDHFSVWLFSRGALKQFRTPDQTPLKLYDGGGISALNRYGCEGTVTNRQLVKVSADLVDRDNFIYEGERVTYKVDSDGIAQETSRVSGTGTQDNPLFQADPKACL